MKTDKIIAKSIVPAVMLSSNDSRSSPISGVKFHDTQLRSIDH